MGVNEHGLFVGLTNQRTFATPSPRARSRGEVVRAALDAPSVDALLAQLASLQPDAYNAFNLLFGDGARLFAAYVRPERAEVEIEAVPEGIGVLPNDRIGAAGFPKAALAVRLATPLASQPWPELSRGLATVLADHRLADPSALPTPPPDSHIDAERLLRHSAICTHTDTYGTCSSAIVATEPGRVHSYLHAEGPPCVTPFAECVETLR